MVRRSTGSWRLQAMMMPKWLWVAGLTITLGCSRPNSAEVAENAKRCAGAETAIAKATAKTDQAFGDVVRGALLACSFACDHDDQGSCKVLETRGFTWMTVDDSGAVATLCAASKSPSLRKAGCDAILSASHSAR